jgi:hypothetical protein
MIRTAWSSSAAAAMIAASTSGSSRWIIPVCQRSASRAADTPATCPWKSRSGTTRLSTTLRPSANATRSIQPPACPKWLSGARSTTSPRPLRSRSATWLGAGAPSALCGRAEYTCWRTTCSRSSQMNCRWRHTPSLTVRSSSIVKPDASSSTCQRSSSPGPGHQAESWAMIASRPVSRARRPSTSASSNEPSPYQSDTWPKSPSS